MVAMVRRIPARMPGKKPASTAAAGNLSQLLLQAAGRVELPLPPPRGVPVAEADDEADDEEEPVEEGFGDDVEDADEGADDDAAEPWRTHSLLLQSYPAGQQVSGPQLGRLPASWVVCRGLVGNAVALRKLREQGIGLMVLQDLPAGQHIADSLLLKTLQVVSGPQQKFAGSP